MIRDRTTALMVWVMGPYSLGSWRSVQTQLPVERYLSSSSLAALIRSPGSPALPCHSAHAVHLGAYALEELHFGGEKAKAQRSGVTCFKSPAGTERRWARCPLSPAFLPGTSGKPLNLCVALRKMMSTLFFLHVFFFRVWPLLLPDRADEQAGW